MHLGGGGGLLRAWEEKLYPQVQAQSVEEEPDLVRRQSTSTVLVLLDTAVVAGIVASIAAGSWQTCIVASTWQNHIVAGTWRNRTVCVVAVIIASITASVATSIATSIAAGTGQYCVT